MDRTAGELAEYLGGKLEGEPLLPISGLAGPDQACATDIIYLDSVRHRARAASSMARCVLAQPGIRIEGKTIIEADLKINLIKNLKTKQIIYHLL